MSALSQGRHREVRSAVAIPFKKPSSSSSSRGAPRRGDPVQEAIST